MENNVSVQPRGILEWQVVFRVGIQSFDVGPLWDTKEEGCWYARQLIKALLRLSRS